MITAIQSTTISADSEDSNYPYVWLQDRYDEIERQIENNWVEEQMAFDCIWTENGLLYSNDLGFKKKVK